MNLNKAQIIGRVTRDPESRMTPGGTAVVTFSVATNYKYKDSAGNTNEKVSFHNCVDFGKLGSEVIAKFCVKGQEVYVGGRLDYQEWTKQDGTKGKSTQIIVEDFQLGQKPVNAVAKPVRKPQEEPIIEIPEEPMDDEDIRVEDIPF